MDKEYQIEHVSDLDHAAIFELANLTQHVVHGGASIGFMENCQKDDMVVFWTAVSDKVAQKKTLLLIARALETNQIIGTVQLQIDLPKNQPHRADLAKMHVHALHRRKGIAKDLLLRAEEIALQHGRYILVLDTVTDSDAQNLYLKCGWVEVGHIPEYALLPNGELCGTTYMYRKLH